MRVKWLKLKNFRNYDELDVEFFDGINLISGKNGQGKTNIVEAVMLGALTKSPRTSHDEDMKKEGSSHTEAEVLIERDFGEVSVKCILDSDAGKKFFVNTNEIKKTSELFGFLILNQPIAEPLKTLLPRHLKVQTFFSRFYQYWYRFLL